MIGHRPLLPMLGLRRSWTLSLHPSPSLSATELLAKCEVAGTNVLQGLQTALLPKLLGVRTVQ